MSIAETTKESDGHPDSPSGIFLTKTDRLRLSELLDNRKKDDNCVAKLKKKIRESVEIDKTKAPRDLVTMNTMFRGVLAGNKWRDSSAVKILTLTYPNEHHVSEGSIPVTTPLGTDLLGARKGDVILWVESSGDSREMIIDEIIYQPEIYGDWKL